jgi:uncharacterized protein (TIGR02449 family)
MDTALRALEAQVERLIGLTGQLAHEKARLTAELAQSRSHCAQLEHRMREARDKVAAALERLPAMTEPALDTAP